MRLKSLNMDNRSTTHTQAQKEVLTDFSKNINNLGSIFDAMIELENFIIKNILDEVGELISIRERRLEIEGRRGASIYLDEYFTPQSKKINSMMEDLKKEWDNKASQSLKFEELVDFITNLKSLSITLSIIENKIPNFSTVSTLKKLIDEFGKFRVVKALFTADIVERINILLEIGGELQNYSFLEEIQELTIDDV
jgi:hypothetical protein